MKQFNITVNGKTYQVEVEEVSGGSVSAPVARPAERQAVAQAPSAAETVVIKKPEPAAAAPKEIPTGGTIINSPMPGTILDIRVTEGKAVKTGDVLMILEAMKMENEIMAPHDGAVVSVNVAKGASVNSGDILVVLG